MSVLASEYTMDLPGPKEQLHCSWAASCQI